jgi:hypothetical protein
VNDRFKFAMAIIAAMLTGSFLFYLVREFAL